jgi:hypothetical protein
MDAGAVYWLTVGLLWGSLFTKANPGASRSEWLVSCRPCLTRSSLAGEGFEGGGGCSIGGGEGSGKGERVDEIGGDRGGGDGHGSGDGGSGSGAGDGGGGGGGGHGGGDGLSEVNGVGGGEVAGGGVGSERCRGGLGRSINGGGASGGRGGGSVGRGRRGGGEGSGGVGGVGTETTRCAPAPSPSGRVGAMALTRGRTSMRKVTEFMFEERAVMGRILGPEDRRHCSAPRRSEHRICFVGTNDSHNVDSLK